MKPILLGCAGPVLSAAERDFFAAENPFGFILFARNCENPDQVRALARALRDAVGREAPIFVDQEGGRVARLKPPYWPALPAARVVGELYERNKEAGLEAMRLHASITARFLRGVGIDGNFAPVLDLSVPDTSKVMGDRTFSADPDCVAALGGVAVETYLAHGVLPVIKHMPGHGRVKTDPHEVLPFVEADRATLEADFAPFRALASRAPAGMNCHVVFRALDPDDPVTLSRKVHEEIIRGAIGFDGLLFSDDLAMKALSLSPAELGLRALEAGADILLYCPGVLEYCPNVLEVTRAVCAPLPPLSAAARSRWERALSARAAAPPAADWAADLQAFETIMNA